MWAMTNRHKTIAKVLLDHGASPDIKSSSGGTAFDFVQPGTDISQYLHENGYNFGPSHHLETDFYDSGFGGSRFEEEIAENEMRRRMIMEESAVNLEVDLSSLGMDEKYDVSLIIETGIPANAGRLLMTWNMISQSLSGTNACMIKCLYSRRAN